MQKVHSVYISNLLNDSQDGTFMSQSYFKETTPPSENNCATIASVLSRIGDKWSIQVIVLLDQNTKRFSEIKKEIPTISQKMLTSTLRNLERDGLVKRTVYPTMPVQVEYCLTELGQSLWHVVDKLGQWAIQHVDEIIESRANYDQIKAF